MKQIVKTAQFLLLSAVLFCAWGCMSDFDAINRNPSEATDEELGRENYKISTNLRGLQNWVVPVQEHRCDPGGSDNTGRFSGDLWRVWLSGCHQL